MPTDTRAVLAVVEYFYRLARRARREGRREASDAYRATATEIKVSAGLPVHTSPASVMGAQFQGATATPQSATLTGTRGGFWFDN